MDLDLTLSGYGVTLRRLTEDKIEMVRHWRNHPKIQQYMDYREHITAEQQKRWFASINNDWNYYFVVEFDGKEVGLIDIKNVSADKNSGESGIFLWDDSVYGKRLSQRALLVLHDFAFEKLGKQSLIAHILQDNIRSQRCYLSLGFELCEGQESVELQKYALTKERHCCIRQGVVSRITTDIKVKSDI